MPRARRSTGGMAPPPRGTFCTSISFPRNSPRRNRRLVRRKVRSRYWAVEEPPAPPAPSRWVWITSLRGSGQGRWLSPEFLAHWGRSDVGPEYRPPLFRRAAPATRLRSGRYRTLSLGRATRHSGWRSFLLLPAH